MPASAAAGARHPVADLLLRAWRGPRPDVDGSWARVAPWREGVFAVVAVTGQALVSAPDRVTDAQLASWQLDGWGHAHDPRVMTRLAGEDGWVDVLDAVLLAEGTGAPEPWLVIRPDLRDHPRVRHALPIRDDVQVFGLDGDDEPLAACVSPANVPNLRALWSVGFDPVGSVQVYRPRP